MQISDKKKTVDLEGNSFNCYDLKLKDLVDFKACQTEIVKDYNKCEECKTKNCVFKKGAQLGLSGLSGLQTLQYYERIHEMGSSIVDTHCGPWTTFAKNGSSFLFLPASVAGTGSSIVLNPAVVQFAMPDEGKVVIKGVAKLIAEFKEELEEIEIKKVPRKVLSNQEFLKQMDKLI